MKTFTSALCVVALLLAASFPLEAQTVTLTFQGGAVTAGPKYTFEVFAHASVPVKMGTANLVFSYSTVGFGPTATATLTPSNYSGGNYQPVGFTDFGVGKKSINIELNSDNNGTEIGTVSPGTLVGVIEMTIANASASAGLVWDAADSPIYADDNATLLTTVAGNTDDSGPLPIQLVNIVAEVKERAVQLEWTTASEKNNYGFEIERRFLGATPSNQLVESVSKSLDTAWTKVGFVAGHGTTLEPQNYQFVDKPGKGGWYGYRLKQVDMDGKFEHLGKVEVEVGIPKAFALYQNYPNPFNPTTIISYALPKGDRVTLRLYDLLGRVVKTLVDDSQDAGIYEVRFSATGGSASGGEASSIASGVYFYRLQAGSFVQTKKMLVVK